MKKVLLAIILILPLFATAQSPEKLLNLGVSANAYNGDLGGHFEKWTAIFHVGLKFNRKKRFNGNLNLGFGTINGQGTIESNIPPAPTPNNFFNTNIIYGNYDLQFNIIKNKHWIIYVSQGIGILRFNPRDQFFEDLQDRNETRADSETYGNTSLILPTKAGVVYLLRNGYGAGIEAGLFNTTTDYIDNISQLGAKEGSDNIMAVKFSFFIPITVNEKK